ncbi:MAG: FMN-binding protein [Nitrospirae bacterium]|nr:MAG: FMN-binding protein [Nitrospirota bacterium]
MTFKDILKISFNLVALYLIGGVLIAAVYSKTSPIIYRNNEIAKAKALKEMMPEADEICYIFEINDETLEKARAKGLSGEAIGKLETLKGKTFVMPKEKFLKEMENVVGKTVVEQNKLVFLDGLKVNDWEIHEKHAEFYVAKKNGNTIGYIVQSFGKGYSSYINTLVAVSPDFTVQKINILHHAETPGLGDEIMKDWFKKQFAGKDVEHLKVDKTGSRKDYIQAITGATISSRAVSEDAVKNGVLFLQKKLKELNLG